jgi:hypothetical protein
MGPDDRMQYPPAQSSMRHLHIQVSWPQRSARASNNNNLVAARGLGSEAPGLPSPETRTRSGRLPVGHVARGSCARTTLVLSQYAATARSVGRSAVCMQAGCGKWELSIGLGKEQEKWI